MINILIDSKTSVSEYRNQLRVYFLNRDFDRFFDFGYLWHTSLIVKSAHLRLATN